MADILPLKQSTPSQPQRPTSFPATRSGTIKYLLLCLGLVLLPEAYRQCFRKAPVAAIDNIEPLCPQTTALTPRDNAVLHQELGALYSTDEFKETAINWISGAVKIPTESYDVMGPIGEDSRWEVFGLFHDYLRNVFPHIHATLSLKKVNTYGLLYHWQGVDDSLKPILLMAHQDVVPVEPLTLDKWIHPPYSGYYDGQYVWGRGSHDDKSGLIGMFSAIETLIEKGFKPSRTVVISIGFDEEISGLRGATALSREVLKTYGPDGFAFLVDEGRGFGEHLGTVFAVPGIGEKGYFDARVTVRTRGGHSSTPPEHTSIGILAKLLVHLESNPFEPRLARSMPTYGTIQCYGAHGKRVSPTRRDLIKRSLRSDKALEEVGTIYVKDSYLRAQISTTQAVDLINGGVKVNALPESAEAVINHRIATDSSVAAVQDRYVQLLGPLAKEFNLTFDPFGHGSDLTEESASGTLTLTDAFGHALEPAPVTPTDPSAEPYKLLSGTIIATFESSARFKELNQTIVVAPGISTGNTDTKYFWKSTRHIFRYNHLGGKSGYPGGGIHTINEALSIDSFIEQIKFFTTLILNADESKTL